MTAKTTHNYLNSNVLFISLENPEVKSQPTVVSTFAIRTSQHTTNPDFYREQKSFHLTDPKEKLFLKNFQRFKKNKKRNAQPTLNDTTTQ
jgi:uncharacterized membrane protein YgaE (UPF0421/DUF939 family)